MSEHEPSWEQADPTFPNLGESPDDPRPHYVVKVVDFPPRSITCRCGDVFSGPDPVAQIRDHMQEGNP